MIGGVIFCIYIAVAGAIWIAAFFFERDTEEMSFWGFVGLAWPIFLTVIAPITLLMMVFAGLGELHHRLHKPKE